MNNPGDQSEHEKGTTNSNTNDIPPDVKERVLIYIEKMRNRFWWFAGINIVVVVGFVIGLWNFALAQAKEIGALAASVATQQALDDIKSRKRELHNSLDSSIRDSQKQFDNYATDLKVKYEQSLDTLGTLTRDLRNKKNELEELEEDLEQGQRDLQNTEREIAGTRERLQSTGDLINNLVAEMTRMKNDESANGLEILGQLLSELRNSDNGKLLTAINAQIEYNLLPLGSIAAWHKELFPESNIPLGWVECNGPIDLNKLSDEQRKYLSDVTIDLSKIPNLNGERRFLRGHHESGLLENASAIPIFAEYGGSDDIYVGRWASPGAPFSDVDSLIEDKGLGRIRLHGTTQPEGGASRPRAARIRPTNMSVVWIIRVK